MTTEKDDQHKKDHLDKTIQEETDSGGTDSSIAFVDFTKTDAMGKTMNEMRQALLGVAEVETGILQKIKNHLDQMLDHVYQQMRDYKHLATIDAMVSDQPVTIADPAISTGLDHISQNLNEKNLSIVKLEHELETLGAGVFVNSNMSADMLRQQLAELNKRNKALKSIHYELTMIVGEVLPKNLTATQIKNTLESLNEQIKQLNETNVKLKAQIKQQRLQVKTQTTSDNEPKPNESTSSAPTFRRR